MQIPDDWQHAADQIVASSHRRRVVMVVGASDVGKSSFCAYLASQLQGAGQRTAVVDADIGQASIGRPRSLALALSPGLWMTWHRSG
jgi:polynucleotide 5'-hydroxyl-kinase GRC3/NOL9